VEALRRAVAPVEAQCQIADQASLVELPDRRPPPHWLNADARRERERFHSAAYAKRASEDRAKVGDGGIDGNEERLRLRR
jgi:hypothetical protein